MGNFTGGPFISEIHYDNAGADVGEFVEICAPTGTDVTGFQLVFYNGNGTVINTVNVDPITPCDGGDGNDYYIISQSIQNGAPDGMALVNGSGGVCEFISYEGVISATAGPAAGTMSVDIGVAEGGATAIGTSMQLQPGGGWLTGIPETPKLPNICFLEGTSILTEDGYKVIECLKAGEKIITSEGKLESIKWIGCQTVDPKEITNPLTSNPIRIKAGALRDQVPVVDTLVSPNHGIYVQDLLINAGALENGINIAYTNPKETFRYYHVELEVHALIIAEGLWAESYLPQKENRLAFDNGAAYEEQYPYGNKIILWPLNIPRISAKNKVPDYISNQILLKQKIKKTA